MTATDTSLNRFLSLRHAAHNEHRDAAHLASLALDTLVAAFAHRTGQSFKLRALLFSLYNGKRADLSDVLCLDWELRKAFCAVLLDFGFESPSAKVKNFFYEALKSRLEQAGQFDWFLEESEN